MRVCVVFSLSQRDNSFDKATWTGCNTLLHTRTRVDTFRAAIPDYIGQPAQEGMGGRKSTAQVKLQLD